MVNAAPTNRAYYNRVMGDKYHRAPVWMQNDIAASGTASIRKGGDGRRYLHVRVPGVIDGKQGTSEYIVSNSGRGELTHTVFRPDNK